MKQSSDNTEKKASCHVHQDEASGLTLLDIATPKPLADYREAIELANRITRERFGEVMMLSWYDRDRDFESPQHASECHLDSAIPGYVDYGVHHGATLVAVIEAGRFVFYYTDLEP